MDGDEKGSCGTAVCDGGPGDVAEGEAEADGAKDVTPVDAPAEPVSAPDDSAPDASAPEPEPDETLSDDPVPDGSVSDSTNSDGAPDEPETVEPEPESEPEVTAAAAATDTASDAATDALTRRQRPYLRRGVVALVGAGFVALGVGAFTWISPSPEAADQRFVEAAQSKGHVVAAEQQPLIVSAARKICDRRVIHETDRERRATALTSDEIAAVGTAFGADTRDFTTLALKTYCSS